MPQLLFRYHFARSYVFSPIQCVLLLGISYHFCFCTKNRIFGKCDNKLYPNLNFEANIPLFLSVFVGMRTKYCFLLCIQYLHFLIFKMKCICFKTRIQVLFDNFCINSLVKWPFLCHCFKYTTRQIFIMPRKKPLICFYSV